MMGAQGKLGVIWLLMTWIHVYFYQAMYYAPSTLLFLSLPSIKTKKKKNNKREISSSWNCLPPLQVPRVSNHLPIPIFCLLHRWKTEFLVLFRLGYRSLQVPAAAVNFMIFQLPPLLKICFKKSLDGIQYNIVEKQQTWASSKQPARTPSPLLVNKKPWIFVPYPKRVIKFSKCLESRQDPAMQSDHPLPICFVTHRSGWALCFLGENEQFECLPPSSLLPSHPLSSLCSRWMVPWCGGACICGSSGRKTLSPTLGFHT